MPGLEELPRGGLIELVGAQAGRIEELEAVNAALAGRWFAAQAGKQGGTPGCALAWIQDPVVVEHHPEGACTGCEASLRRRPRPGSACLPGHRYPAGHRHGHRAQGALRLRAATAL